MKPIAIDLGKVFWVIARTDDQGQPEVATIGDNGLIPAVISEYNGKLMLAHYVEEAGGLPPVQDLYQLLAGEEPLRSMLGDRLRERIDGGTELFADGQWWPTESLVAEMLRMSVKVVKDYLSPNAPLPAVVALPPGMSEVLLSRLHQSLADAELRLVSWCDSAVAMAFCDDTVLSPSTEELITAQIERGRLILSWIHIEGGVPYIRCYQSLEWPLEQAPPFEQLGALVDSLYSTAQDIFSVKPSPGVPLLVAGEESWVAHTAMQIARLTQAEHVPFHRPHLAVSMGAARLAELMQSGLFCSQVQGPVADCSIVFRGITAPYSSLQVSGGLREVSASVEANGSFMVDVPLRPNEQTLLIEVTTPQGEQLSKQIQVFCESGDDFDDEEDATDFRSPEVVLSRGSESTRPDLEVPAEIQEESEILESGEIVSSFSLGDSSASLELELNGSSDGLAQGDGATKVLQLSAAIAQALGQGGGETKVLQSPLLDAEQGDGLLSFAEGDGSTKIISQEHLGVALGIYEKKEGLKQGSSAHEVMAVSADSLPDAMQLDLVSSAELDISDEDILDISDDDVVEEIEDEDVVAMATLGKMSEGESSSDHTSSETDLSAMLESGDQEEVSPDEVMAALREEGAFYTKVAEQGVTTESGQSLESLAKEAKDIRSAGRRERLGLEQDESTQEPCDALPNVTKASEYTLAGEVDENSESRSLQERARQRVEARRRSQQEQEEIPSAQELGAAVHTQVTASAEHAAVQAVLERMASAREMTRQARAMMEEAQTMALAFEEIEFRQDLARMLANTQVEALELESSERRESRKILDMGRRILDVEQSRLPGSTRKIISRLCRELEKELEESESRTALKLALQLANRLFETIRRDLRPW